MATCPKQSAQGFAQDLIAVITQVDGHVLALSTVAIASDAVKKMKEIHATLIKQYHSIMKKIGQDCKDEAVYKHFKD